MRPRKRRRGFAACRCRHERPQQSRERGAAARDVGGFSAGARGGGWSCPQAARHALPGHCSVCCSPRRWREHDTGRGAHPSVGADMRDLEDAKGASARVTRLEAGADRRRSAARAALHASSSSSSATRGAQRDASRPAARSAAAAHAAAPAPRRLDDDDARGHPREADDIDRIAHSSLLPARSLGGTAKARGTGAARAGRDPRGANAGSGATCARGDASVRVAGDAEALNRLLDNLIDNAMRYGADPVEIEVGSKHGQARITVRDHGPGIAARDFERALEPFTRLDSARAGSGSCGLGLAMSIASRRPWGADRASRHAGGGLTWEVTLAERCPMNSEQEQSPAAADCRPSSNAGASQSGGQRGLRIPLCAARLVGRVAAYYMFAGRKLRTAEGARRTGRRGDAPRVRLPSR